MKTGWLEEAQPFFNLNSNSSWAMASVGVLDRLPEKPWSSLLLSSTHLGYTPISKYSLKLPALVFVEGGHKAELLTNIWTLTATSWTEFYYCFHFTDEDPKAKRFQGSQPRAYEATRLCSLHTLLASALWLPTWAESGKCLKPQGRYQTKVGRWKVPLCLQGEEMRKGQTNNKTSRWGSSHFLSLPPT